MHNFFGKNPCAFGVGLILRAYLGMGLQPILRVDENPYFFQNALCKVRDPFGASKVLIPFTFIGA
jgi:hypothetical protein